MLHPAAESISTNEAKTQIFMRSNDTAEARADFGASPSSSLLGSSRSFVLIRFKTSALNLRG
jgi:hypothetical protein